MRFLIPFTFLICLVLLSGCREPHAYEVAIYESEALAPGDTVYLDNQPVATIEDIYRITDDQAVAKIRLQNKDAEDLFTKGIQRKPVQGEIHLETTGTGDAENGATLLPGSRIPLRSIPVPPAFWPPNQNTVIVLGILLAALIVVFFIFRTIIKATLTLVALALAIGGAYLTYPFLVPYTQQALELTQDQAAAIAADETQPPAAESGSIDQALEKMGGFVQREDINPGYLSFGLLAIMYFILLSIILGSARKRLASA
ncbi:MAG: hypothetical protein ACFE0O_04420 [Opitutales bacterium]